MIGEIPRSRGRRAGNLTAGSTSRPASWIQRVTALALLAGMIIGLNVHLLVFQIYGWSGMVLDYRETSNSWSEAARQTLSGEAPCTVCDHVEAALKVNEDLLSIASAEEIPFQAIFFFLLIGTHATVPVAPSFSETIGLTMATPLLLTPPPPAPPPRTALV